LLHSQLIQPERSLGDLQPDNLLQLFSTNSLVAPLLAKHLFRLFRNPDYAVFASLSALVGSIEDNRLGGWYGYRASKAALNMFLKTVAIEFERRRCNTTVLAIHPGTTVTELSKPFIKHASHHIHSPEETASNLINLILNRTIKDNGTFWSWTGEKLPW